MPTIKSQQNKKSIKISNKKDNDIEFVTRNKYSLLENKYDSFNSCSADKFTNAYINYFPTANTSDMKHYMQLPIKFQMLR